MSVDGASLEELVDTDAIVRWALEAAAIPSPTGSEQAVAEYFFRELAELGLQVKLQHVAPGRPNVVGRLEGTGGGLSLLLNAHLDTFARIRPDDRYVFGIPDVRGGFGEPPTGSHLTEDGTAVVGDQLPNMKSAMVAYLAAVDAVRRSGVELPGDVIVAGVVGGDPTSAWTEDGPRSFDDERGIGTRHLLANGVSADLCVLGEPTSLGVMTVYLGRARARLAIRPDPGAAAPPGGTAGLRAVLADLEEWLGAYPSRHVFQETTGWGYIAGARTRAGLVSESVVHLEFRTLPGERPLDILDELRAEAVAIAARHRLRIVVEPLQTEAGFALDPGAPLVEALRAAHRGVTGETPPHVELGYGADAPRLNVAGVPTVIYGPGDLTSVDEQPIASMRTAAAVFARLVLDVCSRPR